MVRLLLSIQADLENVTDLVPASSSFDYFFEVKCTSCHEVHSKLVTVNSEEEREVSGGKNSKANFVWKCSNCKRESSASIAGLPQAYSAEANGQLAPFLTVECRGLEFVGFDPQGNWRCRGAESGAPFDEVTLDEGEWVDYDEKAALPVGVSNIKSNWKRA